MEVILRIEKILMLSKSGEENILFISHGFFLKVIEAYIRDKSIKENPINLLKYFDGSHETFKFCEGFVVIYEREEFVFRTYIRNKSEI